MNSQTHWVLFISNSHLLVSFPHILALPPEEAKKRCKKMEMRTGGTEKPLFTEVSLKATPVNWVNLTAHHTHVEDFILNKILITWFSLILMPGFYLYPVFIPYTDIHLLPSLNPLGILITGTSSTSGGWEVIWYNVSMLIVHTK